MKLKEIICFLFGHIKSDYGYCKRCGWFDGTQEYKKLNRGRK